MPASCMKCGREKERQKIGVDANTGEDVVAPVCPDRCDLKKSKAERELAKELGKTLKEAMGDA